MGNCIQTAGPNEVLYCSGEEGGFVVENGGWIFESVNNIERLDTSAILLKLKCESVERVDGMMVNIGGVAVVTVLGMPPFLSSAQDFCMDKDRDEIQKSLENIIENHIRELVGHANLEVFKDLIQLSRMAREILISKIGRHGFEIWSLSLYLDSTPM